MQVGQRTASRAVPALGAGALAIGGARQLFPIGELRQASGAFGIAAAAVALVTAAVAADRAAERSIDG